MMEPDRHRCDEIRIDGGSLAAFVGAILRSVGIPAEDTKVVAAALVEADLRGVITHGSMLLPGYVRDIQSGSINVRPYIRLVRETPGTALLDGDNAMGHLVAVRAMELAIAKAKSNGIGIVGAFDSNHFGAAGYFAALAARADCVGVVTSTTYPRPMAPWGGRDPLLSNCPLAIAAPSGSTAPAVLDVATSRAARGKIILAAAEGEAIPEKWALDSNYEPTTDPERALRGSLRPLGEHKGSGLAYMLESLCSLLTGAVFDPQESAAWARTRTSTSISHAMLAIDVAAFRDPIAFKTALDRKSAEVRSAAPAPGFERVSLPGDGSQARYEEALRRGVPMPAVTVESLETLARELGVAGLRATGQADIARGSK